ncbi:MAG: hypothetical protein ACI35R_11105 [Bacillus sp. (in: firmicutes)]
MAEYSRFFDSVQGDRRVYNAADFAEYFKRIVTNGIYIDQNKLNVSATGSNMTVTVGSGSAFIEGYMYINTSNKTLTVASPEPYVDRVDRVVLRLDRSAGERNIKAIVLKGTAGSNPSPPALQRDAYIYDIPLAQIRVIQGQSYIGSTQVTDERTESFGEFVRASGATSRLNTPYGLTTNDIRFKKDSMTSYPEITVDNNGTFNISYSTPNTYNTLFSVTKEGTLMTQNAAVLVSGIGQNLIPPKTWTTITAGSVEYDNRGAWTSDGFRAPESGIYLVNAHTRFSINANADTYQMGLQLGNYLRRMDSRMFGTAGAPFAVGTTIVRLSKGDLAQVRVYTNTTANSYASETEIRIVKIA